jgi:hypothetical protein
LTQGFGRGASTMAVVLVVTVFAPAGKVLVAVDRRMQVTQRSPGTGWAPDRPTAAPVGGGNDAGIRNASTATAGIESEAPVAEVPPSGGGPS